MTPPGFLGLLTLSGIPHLPHRGITLGIKRGKNPAGCLLFRNVSSQQAHAARCLYDRLFLCPSREPVDGCSAERFSVLGFYHLKSRTSSKESENLGTFGFVAHTTDLPTSRKLPTSGDTDWMYWYDVEWMLWSPHFKQCVEITKVVFPG